MNGAQLGAHLVDTSYSVYKQTKIYCLSFVCEVLFQCSQFSKGVDELGYVLDYKKKLVKECAS